MKRRRRSRPKRLMRRAPRLSIASIVCAGSEFQRSGEDDGVVRSDPGRLALGRAVNRCGLTGFHGLGIVASMTQSGYSQRRLVDKLGIKRGMRALFVRAPDHYADLLGPLPDGIDLKSQLRGEFDFIHAFCDRQADLHKNLPRWRQHLRPVGMLWVSWPKKASGVKTDIIEDVIRHAALGVGLVEIKVAAVDEIWSGLKLVIRKQLRD